MCTGTVVHDEQIVRLIKTGNGCKALKGGLPSAARELQRRQGVLCLVWPDTIHNRLFALEYRRTPRRFPLPVAARESQRRQVLL